MNQNRLRSNTMNAERPAAGGQQAGRDAPGSVARGRGVCPSDQEVRNIETSATSMFLRDKGREKDYAFMQAEVQRAKRCDPAASAYSADDWRAIADLHSAMATSNGWKGARERIEAIHLGAAAAEQRQQIQADRQTEAQQREAREELRKQMQRCTTLPSGAISCPRN